MRRGVGAFRSTKAGSTCGLGVGEAFLSRLADTHPHLVADYRRRSATGPTPRRPTSGPGRRRPPWWPPRRHARRADDPEHLTGQGRRPRSPHRHGTPPTDTPTPTRSLACCSPAGRQHPDVTAAVTDTQLSRLSSSGPAAPSGLVRREERLDRQLGHGDVPGRAEGGHGRGGIVSSPSPVRSTSGTNSAAAVSSARASRPRVRAQLVAGALHPLCRVGGELAAQAVDQVGGVLAEVHDPGRQALRADGHSGRSPAGPAAAPPRRS